MAPSSAMAVEGRPDLDIEVFTTRPDTSFGMTYAVLAPEHPLVAELVTDAHRDEVAELRARALQATDIERQSSEGTLDKRGAFTGSYCVNPFNDERVPIYVADYVLMGYGTGAIMAVPAEDERDFAFAEDTACRSCEPSPRPRASPAGAYAGDGVKINSGFLDGLDVPTAKRVAIEFLEQLGIGSSKVNYRLRDWLISRQRYWGCPIPVVYCPAHGAVAGSCRGAPDTAPRRRRVPADRRVAAALRRRLSADNLSHLRRAGDPGDRHDGHVRGLGLVLPSVLQSSRRDGTRRHRCRSPLHARRPVHRRDHACDLAFALRAFLHTGSGGHRPRPEAGSRAVRSAVLPGHDRLGGRAMSKSKGNVVSPDEYFERVGADSLRLLHLFIGPPVDDVDWSDQIDEIVEGCSRYLGRVWRLATEEPERPRRADEAGDGDAAAGDADELRRAVHHAIARVTADIERYGFNTAVAACMELTNTISRHARAGTDRAVVDESIDTLLELLAPLVPHVAAEAYEHRRGDNVHTRPWPVADVRLLTAQKVTMVVRSGRSKPKDRIEVDRDISEETAIELALASPKVQEILRRRRSRSPTRGCKSSARPPAGKASTSSA